MADNDQEPKEQFKALLLPQREIPAVLHKRYRVYKNAQEYVLVEAANALQALKASGLERSCRIQRDSIFFHNILKIKPAPDVSEEETVAVAVAASPAQLAELPSPPQDTTPPPPVAAPPPPVNAAALSNADVEKLLQG